MHPSLIHRLRDELITAKTSCAGHFSREENKDKKGVHHFIIVTAGGTHELVVSAASFDLMWALSLFCLDEDKG